MEGDRSLLARETRFTRDDAEFDRAIGFVDATNSDLGSANVSVFSLVSRSVARSQTSG